jgi:hypothetical protein
LNFWFESSGLFLTGKSTDYQSQTQIPAETLVEVNLKEPLTISK